MRSHFQSISFCCSEEMGVGKRPIFKVLGEMNGMSGLHLQNLFSVLARSSSNLIVRAGVHFLGGSLLWARCFLLNLVIFKERSRLECQINGWPPLIEPMEEHRKSPINCYTALSNSTASSCSLSAVLWGRCHYWLHFMGKKTEPPRLSLAQGRAGAHCVYKDASLVPGTCGQSQTSVTSSSKLWGFFLPSHCLCLEKK